MVWPHLHERLLILGRPGLGRAISGSAMRFPVLVILLLASLACSATMAPRLQHAISRFDKAVDQAFHAKEVDRPRLVSRAYDQSLGAVAANVHALGPDDIRLLLRASHDAYFFTLQERYVRTEQRCLEELRSRGMDTHADAQLLYGSYIKARRFKQADALADGASGLGRIPLDAESGPRTTGRPLYEVRNGLLHAAGLKLGQGPSIVVVAHPLCHFCRSAIAAIEADQQLRPIFHDHSHWIVPPGEDLDVPAVSQWNQQYPAERLALVVSKKDWPEASSWATPTFYFFLHGKLEQTVVGWDALSKAKLLRSARQVGLLARADQAGH